MRVGSLEPSDDQDGFRGEALLPLSKRSIFGTASRLRCVARNKVFIVSGYRVFVSIGHGVKPQGDLAVRSGMRLLTFAIVVA